ncbi:uncharacterized protein JCM15063_004992 [Sporobolomyces koalae]|uniref:uncharacterized protein n=1 Tax=Sporobolomyces koalae TaxID=500713 RepID=UPI00316D53A1
MEPSHTRSRRSMNMFRKEVASRGFVKRMSRAVSGQTSNTNSPPCATPARQSSCPPSPVQTSFASTLSPIPLSSPTFAAPAHLSPSLSIRSSSSASGRSIRRKAVPVIEDATAYALSWTPFATASSSEHDMQLDVDVVDSRGKPVCEIVDGLWTSTVDLRVQEPLPWWCNSPASSPSLSSPKTYNWSTVATTRLSRITSRGLQRPLPERSSTKSPLPELELPWLPTLFPEGTPRFDDDDSFVRVEYESSSPAFSTYSSYFNANANVSASSSSSSSDSCPSPTLRVPRVLPPTDRKSLLRLESGGRPFVFDSSRSTPAAQMGSFESENEDDGDVLVIRLPQLP